MALKEDQWKEKKASVRGELVVSGMRLMIVHQNDTESHEVEARREKEASEAEVRPAEFCWSFVQDGLIVSNNSSKTFCWYVSEVKNSITECLVEF